LEIVHYVRVFLTYVLRHRGKEDYGTSGACITHANTILKVGHEVKALGDGSFDLGM
jgi:hypothetical protein